MAPVRALGRFMLAPLPASTAAEVDHGICRPTGSRIAQPSARTGRLLQGRAGAQFNLWARPRHMRFDQDQEAQLLAHTRADASVACSQWPGMYNTTALCRWCTSRGAALVGSRRQLVAGALHACLPWFRLHHARDNHCATSSFFEDLTPCGLRRPPVACCCWQPVRWPRMALIHLFRPQLLPPELLCLPHSS